MTSSNALDTPLAYDDTGGDGRLLILLPGAGDLRSEHRLLAPLLRARGHRVVTADLPGHGESEPAASYGVAEAGAAIVDLIDHLGAGPAVVVGCSFAPAAAVWAATEAPDRIAGLVMISPHLEAVRSPMPLLALALKLSLSGPWATAIWSKLYRSWYRNPPADLDAELAKMEAMLSDPRRRRAARMTLTAGREGMGRRLEELATPTLVVFGSADNHFPDPEKEAEVLAGRLGAGHLLVAGAGHYPHVEYPAVVGAAIGEFVDRLR